MIEFIVMRIAHLS